MQLEAEQQLLSRCRYSAVLRVPRCLYGVEKSFESPVTCFLTSIVDWKTRDTPEIEIRCKYITVDLSRSSSLAVINSARSYRVTFAAVGSWMLWQFLLAWLWKSEPTCYGLVSIQLWAQLRPVGHLMRFIGSAFFGQIGFWHSALIPHFYGWHCCTSPIAGAALDGWWGAAWYLSLARSRSTEWAANRQGLVWGGNTGCDNEHNDRWRRVSMLKWNVYVVKWSGCVASTLSGSLGVWDFAWGHREHLIPVSHLWGHWSSNNLTATKTLQSCWSGIGCLEINTIFSIDSYKLQGRLKAMSSIQSWSIGFSWNFALGRK